MNRLKGLAKSVIVPSPAKGADPFAAALRIGKEALQAEAESKKKEDGEGGSKQRLKELNSFVESSMQKRGSTLTALWREASDSSHPKALEEFEYQLSQTFKGAAAEVLEHLHQFADEESKGRGKAIKQATFDAQTKLERLRIASNVMMENKEKKMQAEFMKMLDDKVEELSKGGDALMRQATQRNKELSEQLHETQMKCTSTEDQLTIALLENAKCKTVLEQASQAQAGLKPCFSLVEMTPPEDNALLVQINALAGGLGAYFRRRDQLASVEAGYVKQLEESVAKATNDAELARIEAAEELKRQLGELNARLLAEHEEAMAEQMRKLNLAAAAAAAEASRTATLCTTLEGQRDEALERARRAEAEVQRMLDELSKSSNKDEVALRQEIVALRKEIDKLRNDVSGVQSSLEKALGENGTLIQQMSHREAFTSALQNEMDQSKSALQETLKQLGIQVDVNTTLSEQLLLLRSTSEKLNDEINRCNAALQATLSELGIVTDENKTLSERLRDLTEATQQATKQVSECRIQLDDTLKMLGLTVDKNRSLSEQLEDLARASKQMADELARMMAALEHLKRDLGFKIDENKTLAENIEALTKAFAEITANYEREKAQGSGALKALKEQLEAQMLDERTKAQRTLERVESERDLLMKRLEAEQAEVARAIAETKSVRERLGARITELEAQLRESRRHEAEAKKSEANRTKELERVQVQHKEMSRRYRMAEAALVHMSKELGTTLIALEQATQAKAEAYAKAGVARNDADARVNQVLSAAKVERELLTKAALHAVHQMQEHVASTLGWLGALHASPDPPPATALSGGKSRHRWGFTYVAPSTSSSVAGDLLVGSSTLKLDGAFSPRDARGRSTTSELPPMPYSARPPEHAANSINPLAASSAGRGQSTHRGGIGLALQQPTFADGHRMDSRSGMRPPIADAWPRPPSKPLEMGVSTNGEIVHSFAEALELGERERSALSDGAVALARACLREAISLEEAEIRAARAASPRRKHLGTF